MPRTAHPNDDEPAWSSMQRVVFRVFFIYTLLYIYLLGVPVLVPDVVVKLQSFVVNVSRAFLSSHLALGAPIDGFGLPSGTFSPSR